LNISFQPRESQYVTIFDADSYDWIPLPVALTSATLNHVAIAVPDDVVSCSYE